MAERTIGTLIRDLRKRRGMTQDDLSQRMFIPKSTISAYENDKIDISASVLQELAAALSVTPGYFFDTTEKTKEEKEIEDIVSTLRNIKNSKVRKVIMEQIKATASLDCYVQ